MLPITRIKNGEGAREFLADLLDSGWHITSLDERDRSQTKYTLWRNRHDGMVLVIVHWEA